GYYDTNGNQGGAASATFTVDTTGPAQPNFAPLNGTVVTDNTTNITLTFAEAVKKDNAGTDFDTAALNALVTLKVDDATGDDIGFTATIDADKDTITIDPTGSLVDGKVYVAVSNAYYDAVGNAGSAASATFTVDTMGPAQPTFAPTNDAVETDNTTNITLIFAEAVKKDTAGADFVDADLASILTLKVGDSSGDDIGFVATIDGDKDTITINPTENLEDGNVYVAVSNAYYDAVGNQGGQASSTFTVDTMGPARPTFTPANSETVTDASTTITLSFAEAVKKDTAGADFTSAADLAAILTLKTGSSEGTDIGFAATIDGDKDTITINPMSDLADGNVYVSVSNAYYDAVGNQGDQASATFTVDTTGPSQPTIAPLNGAVVTDNTTNITLSFAEPVKKDTAGADFTSAADLAAILTLKTGSSGGTDISFAASIDTDNEVITINPTVNLADGNVYVAVSNAYYDAAGNPGSAASATFTVDTTGPAQPTFAPANGAVVTNNTANITLSFAEAVKKDNANADFVDGDLTTILTLTVGSTPITTYSASIDAAKKVIMIDPDATLPDG
ncbi:MAG: Ig-like domain-containing protein, partial [Acidimicrobiaceae bacterium]|nr:Ig-like domain-containing protein [Acidimicrobiaceae bacterium]